jgi:nitric oxide reductase large subunit
MYAQFQSGAEHGYWYIKSLVLPNGSVEGFWTNPLMEKVVWLRLVGDLIAGSGIAILLLKVLRGFKASFFK